MGMSSYIYIGPYVECVPYTEMKYEEVLCCPKDCKGQMKGEFCHSCGSQLITKKVEIGEGASINSEGLMEELRERESLSNILDNFWISNHTNFLDRETHFDSRESEGVLISLPLPTSKRNCGDGIQQEMRKFKERYKEDLNTLVECYKTASIDWGVLTYWM